VGEMHTKICWKKPEENSSLGRRKYKRRLEDDINMEFKKRLEDVGSIHLA
jgi:hypothetical protein